MTTFAETTLALAEVLGEVLKGTADSDSDATKLVDADLHARSGSLAHGTLWMLSGNLSGLVIEITKHAQNTLHFATQGSAVAENDKYAVFTGEKFRLRHLEAAVNLALAELPRYTQDYEDASFVTVANQEEYTLPAGVVDVVRVEIAKRTTSPYHYSMHRCWNETHAGKIRFYAYVPAISGRRIRLGYNSLHPEMDSPSDTLDPGVNLSRLKHEAAAWAWRKYLGRLDKLDADEMVPQSINAARAKAAQQESHMLKRETKLPSLAGW